MTTLALLKSRIADDLNRTDLTSQIADAITDSIEYYKNDRFYFNETRASTFTTVADQSTYSASDDADIPLFFDIDEVWVEDSSGQRYYMSRLDPARMEYLLDNSAASGRPYEWSYFEESFRLFPIPDVSTYTVRPQGGIEKAAPATDGETDNVWMVDAFELIRSLAKKYLAAHVTKDKDDAAMMQAAESHAFDTLLAKTSKRVGSGVIVSTSF